MNFKLPRVLMTLVFSACCVAASGVAARPALDPQYKEFVDGPPSLLITRDEAGAFQKLATNDERDKFVERFWEVRNPAPGLGTNEFKEEFYRRIAYANSFYGKDAGTKGWKTDRGRTYILFGKPQTSMSYHGNQELYATELWFYGNPGLSELPSFFYVLFFEEEGVGGYRVYRPYVDGPEKLLRSGGQTKAKAYRYIKRISAELASATLSYIPGEPQDLETFSGSMQSMLIPNAIQGYREMPSYVSQIRARSARLERVTTHVEYKLASAELTAFAVQQAGKPWLHWRVEVKDPTAKWAASKESFEITSRLYVQGKLVLEQKDAPSFPVPASMAGQAFTRPFIYGDILPVETGKYQLNIEVKNVNTGMIYDASQDVDVRAGTVATNEPALISDVLVISNHAPDARTRPFQFGGIQFEPSPGKYATSTKGLALLYQVLLPAKRPASLIAHYAMAEVSSKARKTFDEPVNLASADAAGALLISRTLPISELGPGRYRLSIRIEDPATKRETATAISFAIASDVPLRNPIIISRGQSDSPQYQASVAYERALCLLAQDRPSEAVRFLDASWKVSNNATVKALLDHLTADTRSGSRVQGSKENSNEK